MGCPEGIKTLLKNLLMILVLASVGLNIYQYRKNELVAQEPASRKQSVEAKEPAATVQSIVQTMSANQNGTYEKEFIGVDGLAAELAEVESELEEAYALYAEKMERVDEKEEAEIALETLRIEQIVENNYMAFFKKLNLSSEKIEAFKKLYVDRNMEIRKAEASFANVNGADEMAISLRAREIIAAYNEKLKESFGDSDYEKFSAYEDRKGARFIVSEYAKTLPTKDRLTDEQKTELVEIWHAGQSEATYEQMVSGVLGRAQESLSQAQVERLEKFIRNTISWNEDG